MSRFVAVTVALLVWQPLVGVSRVRAAQEVAAAIPRAEHPEPMAEREHWSNLNGTWEFRFDPDDVGLKEHWQEPSQGRFDGTIVVPFPWESELSGVHQPKDAPKVGWYRRTFKVPDTFPKADRVWLHFGAVDDEATVWLNGKQVAEHRGGYTPFSVDITEGLKPDGGENLLVVRAFDPTDPRHPTGKQVGWYTTTSGIWQTVWLESRPATHIKAARITTTLGEDPTATYEVEVAGASGPYTIEVEPKDARLQFKKVEGSGSKATLVAKMKEPIVWKPEAPHLYDVTLVLKGPGGQVDRLKTYFGWRTIGRGKLPGEDFERILLNGKPVYLRGALDQSFNPKGIYTAPSEEFLRNDMIIAKYMGLNCLRIHIKTEEPRRLYWADKLGILLLQDVPNTWKQDAEARRAWEATMREAIPRDINHPAIIAWVAFNETWGLGEPFEAYANDKDTQAWVKRMVAAIREIDPTRLVEDNSPCHYNHVEGSDLNSWHFYIDDHAEAKRHIADVVAKTAPGSGFNFCPGEKQDTAPLINSEYGAISAGGGDRDISWGFRDLTTQIRKHNKIQGYIYTELADIEWEHNGFVNYDRTRKAMGYDEFLPELDVIEMQQPDFVGYDAPPAIVAKPGETIKVPVFVSHYSDRTEAPKLRYWLQGWDDKGDVVTAAPPVNVPVEWKPYEVTWQRPIELKVPERPFVGALVLTLRDERNQRFACNFVNVVVKGNEPAPRVRRMNDHDAVLKFRPEEFASSRWSEPAEAPAGKVYGRGTGYFEYRIRVPEVVAKAKPTDYLIRVEAGAKAGRERVDWPERSNPQDYPQSDGRIWPTTLNITINGEEVDRTQLESDKADARGVLSHINGVEHGSYGDLVLTGGSFSDAVKRDIAAGKPLVIRFEVPSDAKPAGGLTIFGADTGMYPLDPTIELTTEGELPHDLGVDPTKSVAVDVAGSRRETLLATGEARGAEPPTWAYTTAAPATGWEKAGFDDSGWKRGPAGFGTAGTPAMRVRTSWDTPEIWARTTVELPSVGEGDLLSLRLFHDEDVQIYVNGQLLHTANGYTTRYQDIPLSAAQKGLFQPGRNTIAVHCKQTGGGQGIDVGLGLIRSEPAAQ